MTFLAWFMSSQVKVWIANIHTYRERDRDIEPEQNGGKNNDDCNNKKEKLHPIRSGTALDVFSLSKLFCANVSVSACE